MKCPKCNKEVGMVDICPLCGEKTIIGENGDMITPSATTSQSSNAEPETVIQDEAPKKKKFSKRLVFEIIGGFLLIFFMLAAFGSVPKTDYDELQKKYNAQAIELEDTQSKLTSTNNEYNSYKDKMEPYEELQSSEAKAKKIEADKIIADKKAADEKAAADKKAADEKAAAEKKAAEDQAAAEARAEADKKAAETVSQKNALKTASAYLSTMSFSHSGLVKQLEFEGYSTDDATYAADNCGADWNEQAAKTAKNYLDTMSFSHDGLVQQLIFEGFSQEQADYGVSTTGL